MTPVVYTPASTHPVFLAAIAPHIALNAARAALRQHYAQAAADAALLAEIGGAK